MGLVNDIVITIELCCLLQKGRSAMPKAASNMVNRFIFTILNRGGINLSISIVMLVLVSNSCFWTFRSQLILYIYSVENLS